MNIIKNTGIMVSAIAVLATSNITFADETVDEYARGGLRHLKLNLADTLDDMQAAIGANTAGVQANANSAAQNSADIAANSADIAALKNQGPVTYDYRDYSRDSTITSKTFDIQNLGGCDKETRTFESTTNGDVTDITMTRVRTIAGAPCRYHKFTFQNTPEGRYRVGTQQFNGSGSRLRNEVILHEPVLLRSSSMQVGIDIGGGSGQTFTDFDAGGVQAFGTFLGKTVLLGVEPVTVAYNGGTTYEGCLKLHVTHDSFYGFGNGSVNRIEYHCPGVGLVKRIQVNGAYYELSDMTIN